MDAYFILNRSPSLVLIWAQIFYSPCDLACLAFKEYFGELLARPAASVL